MSANISIKKNGSAEMMYVGEVPWHGLGTKLPKLATAAEAIKAAGLDWKVEKRALFFEGKGKKDGMVPFSGNVDRDFYATVRTDTETPLGIAGRDWTPLQNSEAFSFSDAIVQEKEAIYETAGALLGGRKVWVMAKLNGVMRIKGSNDQLDRYLLLANSHEVGHALHVKLTTVRVVCQNTLNAALGEKGEAYFRIRHNANIGSKVADAREALGLINIKFAELQEKMDRLAEVKVSKTSLEVFAESLGYKPDAESGIQRDKWLQLQEAFETSPGADMKSAKGTLWGAVNAVTYVVDHNGNFKEKGGVSAEDKKMQSLFWGTGDALKSKAFETAMAMAK